MIASYASLRISDVILKTLVDSSPLTNLELCTRAVAVTGCTPNGVRKAIWFMAEQGVLHVDKTRQKKHLYSISDGEPNRYVVPSSRFKVPLKLRGPVLSPMAWSMAHLLGAV